MICINTFIFKHQRGERKKKSGRFAFAPICTPAQNQPARGTVTYKLFNHVNSETHGLVLRSLSERFKSNHEGHFMGPFHVQPHKLQRDLRVTHSMPLASCRVLTASTTFPITKCFLPVPISLLASSMFTTPDGEKQSAQLPAWTLSSGQTVPRPLVPVCIV